LRILVLPGEDLMKYLRLVGTGLRVIRLEGFRSFLGRTRRRVRKEIVGVTINLDVKTEDALAVDWTQPSEAITNPIVVAEGPVTIAWIMSPPSPNSGGHQNLLRFIDFAEKAGHRCLIYFYTSTPVVVNSKAMKAMLDESPAYPKLQATMSMYDASVGVDPSVQAIFASGWETAYPAYLDKSRAKRFYFIQDFEPGFYPLGSEYMLAENTYRFGFHGITAGGWLSTLTRESYSMKSDHFDFAVDTSRYFVTNPEPRTEIFFYARPSTPRRGFELALMALEAFAAERPGVVINFAGEDISRWEVSFPHVELAGMPISKLNEVYNRCSAGLVISASNMSLLPLELMASGVVPIVNDAPNNRLVSDNPFIEYVPAAPGAIARKLIEVHDHHLAADRISAMSRSLDGSDWKRSGQQFVTAFERAMHG
jgi:glycosyltransferase involved in cell wall biosynthesis